MFEKRTLGCFLFAVLFAVASGCSKDEPKSTRWDQAASAGKASEDQKPPSGASDKGAEKKESGSFNRFFPKDGIEGTSRVFTADKDGYAEAKITKDGKELLLITVTDLNGKDEDKKKFAGKAESLSGNPVTTFGKNKTMVLVKDRYQVGASSSTLDHEARKQWIQKFDLPGLASVP